MTACRCRAAGLSTCGREACLPRKRDVRWPLALAAPAAAAQVDGDACRPGRARVAPGRWPWPRRRPQQARGRRSMPSKKASFVMTVCPCRAIGPCTRGWPSLPRVPATSRARALACGLPVVAACSMLEGDAGLPSKARESCGDRLPPPCQRPQHMRTAKPALQEGRGLRWPLATAVPVARAHVDGAAFPPGRVRLVMTVCPGRASGGSPHLDGEACPPRRGRFATTACPCRATGLSTCGRRGRPSQKARCATAVGPCRPGGRSTGGRRRLPSRTGGSCDDLRPWPCRRPR